jgi:starch-binding outer membrane protein, SusD/RagB family
MKINLNRIAGLTVLPLIFMFLSCEDFLVKNPYSSTPTENITSSYSNLKIALTGLYNHLTDEDYYGKNMILSVDIRGDDTNLKIENSNRMTSEYKYTMTDGSGDAQNAWGIMYKVINQANIILAHIDKVEDGTPAERNQLKGEALAIRAMAYFDLVRLFAQPYKLAASVSGIAAGTPDGNGGHLGVPVVLEPTDDPFTLFPERKTVKAVYDQILSDLDAAIPLMTVSSGPNFFNSMAATALRARVKLYKEDWQGAATDATTVINSGDYSLLTPDNYIQSWGKENSSESIFELALTKTTYLGTTALGYMYDTRGYGDMVASKSLLSLYENGDVRAITKEGEPDNGPPDGDLMFYTVNGFTYTSKYPGRDGTAGLDNTKIIRLSEMYLIRAEANQEASKSIGATPLADINTIRANRNASILSSVNPTIIEQERRRELCFEGHRFFDIVRKGKNLQRGSDYWAAASMAYPNKRFVYPIPDDETNVNAHMVQNPGY